MYRAMLQQVSTELENALRYVGAIVIASALFATIGGLIVVAIPIGLIGVAMVAASWILARRRS